MLVETGLVVATVAVLGGRRTGGPPCRMIYLICQPENDRQVPAVDADDEDLDRAEWAGLDKVRERMPDMFAPVRAHLEATLGSIERF